MQSIEPSKILFFVCPFSQIEYFIRKSFGDVYFATAPGTIFSFDNEAFTQEIGAFISQKHIERIYFLCEINSHFITNALNGGNPFGLASEAKIRALMCQSDNAFSLSQKIIRNQINASKNAKYLSDVIQVKNIQIQGMIASKMEGKLTLIGE